MVEDVFKFPDGKGGYILKIQGTDGMWHVCDEQGHYVEEKEVPSVQGPSNQDEVQQPSKRAKTLRREKAERNLPGRICVCLSDSDSILINDYVAWKSLQTHKLISRSDVLLKAAIAMIKRDSEFMAFIKSQKK